MIMVMDRNRLIGASGGLPWHLPAELQYFKAVTMGKPIIMGRKTLESIGRALPGRTNIVVSRREGEWPVGVLVAGSLDEAIHMARDHLREEREIMIIGGASLCRAAMSRVQRLYLTVIDHAFDGDTWLDSFEESEWVEVSGSYADVDGYRLHYRVLERCESHRHGISVSERV